MAGRIATELDTLPGVSTFLDAKDIGSGRLLPEILTEEIERCDDLLVLLSPHALGSAWVLMEVGAALALGKTVIPILHHITALDLPQPLSLHLARDLNDIEQYYEELRSRGSSRHESVEVAAFDLRVGDYIQVLARRPRRNLTGGGVVEWVSPMDDYRGKIGRVLEVASDRTALLDVDGGKYWWHIDWLTAIPQHNAPADH